MTIYSLQGTAQRYVYDGNRDYSLLTDRFIYNTFKALDHLYEINTLNINPKNNEVLREVGILPMLIKNTSDNIKIIPATHKNYYKPSSKTIGFCDTKGIFFKKDFTQPCSTSNTGYNSPMTLLAHELLHCYHSIYKRSSYLARKNDHTPQKQIIDQKGQDLSFPNMEEVYVVQIINRLSDFLGEDRRSNYGRTYYSVEDVTSIRSLSE